MAAIKRAEAGAPKLIISNPNTELVELDEVVVAGGDSGVYRLLPFTKDDATVQFERVDDNSESRLELSLGQIERRFGEEIRITAPRLARAHV